MNVSCLDRCGDLYAKKRSRALVSLERLVFLKINRKLPKFTAGASIQGSGDKLPPFCANFETNKVHVSITLLNLDVCPAEFAVQYYSCISMLAIL